MKKIILTLLLMFFLTTSSKAQSNLEFSRAVKEKYTFTTAGLNTTLIVPNGKVLKITSATVTPVYTNSGYSSASIDGQIIAFSNSEKSNTYAYATNLVNMIPLPMWLPAGTYIVFAGTSANGTFSYSGIEFNIVP